MRRQKLLLAAVGAILFISAFFVANVPLRAEMWPVSLAAILAFSAPVAYGAVRWLGVRNGGILVATLGLYALLFETVAIKVGLPYGEFQYGQLLGPHLFGAVPATVLVAWSPLVLGIVPIIRRLRSVYAVCAGTGLMVLADMVLDPAAVHLGFWAWTQAGPYYGVPFINFFGWIISGGIAMAVVIWLSWRNAWPKPPAILQVNFTAIIFFWSAVNLFAGQYVPFLIGCGLLFYSFRSLRMVH